MAVVSQPTDPNCDVPQPGAVDAELGEFWVGNPWEIFETKNLSAFERNRLFMNVGGRAFLDVSYVSGADSDGDGRSAIAADFDNDGRLDLAVRQAGGGALLIYENQFSQRNYLTVDLMGTRSNRLGVGARLIARVGARQIVRERYPANTFNSAAPLAVHFGLGDAERVDELTILWPSGERQTLRDLDAGRHIEIVEGDAAIRVVTPGETRSPR